MSQYIVKRNLAVEVSEKEKTLMEAWHVYMSTENSVNRSLKTRSLLTKFGTCSIAATGAVTI